ncbi:MAG: methylenetetrahydrofolate--tRNA-(uracil(54)-C(5))-methyltransferase (FADH(2)-oxidizing) TrmFO [Eubacteriales bacterium]|nr:methylenetetrahydrofolate--tRNA-(uracil(54)-C(5))-methyltransferase (FADH(2)-oxidizing) TrmFO [Eubacteriales bacterium]
MKNNTPVTVLGAGLAGCEAAWQLASRGVPVRLVDMKPHHKSPAHEADGFAELVCSNSLKSERLQNASGLLKEEMRRLGSLIIRAADASRVPAGGALAVDRAAFSGNVSEKLTAHPLVGFESCLAETLPEAPAVIATGPLTAGGLGEEIAKLAGTLHFFDAAAPIVTRESIDMRIAFRQSRYGRGDDYINCPLNEAEYHAFIDALLSAQSAPVHGFEEDLLFEGCMPIESMARRGRMAPAFGPMKPVGLTDPRTGKMPFAAVQLRQDDAGGTLYNLVGFQTRLKFPEQKRVFGLIPGLKDAEFARFGVMHRNTFLQSPGFLDSHFAVKEQSQMYFAGQMTGVEGYVESAASGLTAGLSLYTRLKELPEAILPQNTAIAALGRYISTANRDFQPMNMNYGIMQPLPQRVKGKEKRYLALSERALDDLAVFTASRPELFSGQ